MFKIGFKLSLAVAISTILIIGIYGVITVNEQNNILVTVIERQANRLSETVKNSLRYEMLINQRDHVDRIVQSIVKEPLIRDVRVFNKEGLIIYASNESDEGKMVDRHGEQCYACHAADKPLERLSITERTRLFKLDPDSSRILGIINPVYNEPSCWQSDCHAHAENQSILGVLDVTISLADVDHEIIASERRIIIFTVIAIFSVVVLIILFVKKLVHDPVRELVLATDQVAHGNFTHHIDHIIKDELGVLQQAFNSMTKRLSEARLHLFQSDKMNSVSRLAAGVAHEINNPLTIIMTNTSSVLGQVQNGQVKKDLQNILKETERARNIVKSLLNFARESTPQKRYVDLNQIMTKSIETLSRKCDPRYVAIHTDLPKDIPQIWIDPGQFEQAFRNLIENAIDAIGNSPGIIRIIVKKRHLNPFGVVPIKIASCFRGHDLFQSIKLIKGQAVICLEAVCGNYRGQYYIDPLYGGEGTHYSFDCPENEPVQLWCPTCGVEQTVHNLTCPDCGAPVYQFNAQASSIVEGCTRPSCGWQRWPMIDDQGKQEYLEISVQDTGCGIADEELARVFDPFYTTKGNQGTGLGLSVTWGIVAAHDGTLLLHSEPGSGTIFTMRFPMQAMKSPVSLNTVNTTG